MSKLNRFVFVDVHAKERREKHIRKMQVCDVVSRMVLLDGHMGLYHKNYSEIAAKKYWQFTSLIPDYDEVSKVKMSHVRWYTAKHISSEGQWNGSFLHGLAQCGEIIKNKLFPLLAWSGNLQLIDIIKQSPYRGAFHLSVWKRKNTWSGSPALMLSYDEESFDFMAGVLATGKLYKKKNGEIYACYSSACRKWFNKWHIPIEYTGKKTTLISVFWPAMLQHHMPEICRIWGNVDDAYRTKEYAAILWRIYRDEHAVSGAIPYLPSRRSLFYNYKDVEGGLMKYLEKKRVEYNLTELDSRYKKLIQKIEIV